jgi:hypothetical protein
VRERERKRIKKQSERAVVLQVNCPFNILSANWATRCPVFWNGAGYSTVFAPQGRILACAKSNPCWKEDVVHADVPCNQAKESECLRLDRTEYEKWTKEQIGTDFWLVCLFTVLLVQSFIVYQVGGRGWDLVKETKSAPCASANVSVQTPYASADVAVQTPSASADVTIQTPSVSADVAVQTPSASAHVAVQTPSASTNVAVQTDPAASEVAEAYQTKRAKAVATG